VGDDGLDRDAGLFHGRYYASRFEGAKVPGPDEER
jgi:hypothetical protein